MNDHVRHLRERLLTAPVTDPPPPWQPHPVRPVGGLRAVGFGVAPESGHDLMLVTSINGRGVFDTVTGELLARDDDPDPDLCFPHGSPLTCPGIGPLDGLDVHVAGLTGGGLHLVASTWTVGVTAPDWPDHRIVLSQGGGPWSPGRPWCHVHHATSELRAAGFSSTGNTLVVATASEVWWAHRTDPS